MAFGFPSKYLELIPLNNLSQKTFILCAIEICKKLNWKILDADENTLTAISQNTKNTWNETISVDFDENTATISSSSNGNQIYDRGRNKKNTDSFLNLYFEELKTASRFENSNISFEEQVEKEKRNLSNKQETNAEHITSFYSVLSIIIPTKGYVVTPILIYLNLLIFIVMTFLGVNFFKPQIQDIIDWGGNYGPMVYENEWWRLVTANFIHQGFLTLIISCSSLGYAGLLLESYIKKWQFLTIYLISGIVASLSSLYWNKDIISCGASGAVFGLFATLFIALLFKRFEIKLNLKIILSSIFFITLNLAYNYLFEINFVIETAGFICGLLFGCVLFFPIQKRNYGMAIVSTAAGIAIICMFLKFRNSNVYIYQVMEYEERMQEFVDMEKMAMEAYSSYYGITEQESKENALYFIKERGIYYWEENITLIKELDNLYLPKKIHEHNKKLIEYCKLRIKVYELGFKKIAEESLAYDDQINTLNLKIESLVNEIKNDQITN